MKSTQTGDKDVKNEEKKKDRAPVREMRSFRVIVPQVQFSLNVEAGTAADPDLRRMQVPKLPTLPQSIKIRRGSLSPQYVT